MINKYTITHLNEMYENNFLEKVFKTFKIKNNIDFEKMSYTVNDNSIFIEADNVKYYIEIFADDEYYEIRKDFSNYSIIEMYSLSQELLSKSMSYPINENEKTLIEELDSGEFIARRFVITNQNDEKYLNGHYEKMITEYEKYNIYEDYEYKKNTVKEELNHTFDMDNNCYYHHYLKSANPLFKDSKNVYIESAMAIEKPILFVIGKTKYDNSILINSMQLGKPNILIQGSLKDDNELDIFSLRIEKEKNKYIIKFAYQINNVLKNNIFELKCSNSPIKSEDIEIIEKYLLTNYNLPFIVDIKSDLNKLKKVAEIYENKRKKEIDYITLKLRAINNINELIYDYYFNVKKYMEKIGVSKLKFTK